MKNYFQKVIPLGEPLTERQFASMEENIRLIRQAETEVSQAAEKARSAGIPAGVIHQRKQLTARERNEKLVAPGLVDEIVGFPALREYLCTFIRAAYQNPVSFCPSHLMLLPRLIRR